MAKKKVDKYLGGNVFLPIDITIDYTPEQLMELKRCSEDVCYFAENYFHIINMDAEPPRQKIKLFTAQTKAIRKIIENKRTIICASRQIGKSTLMTVVCLWYVLFREDFQIAILANKEDQAKEILERIKMAYEEIPNWLKAGVREFTKEVLLLTNNSKIFVSTTSESGIRGKTVNLLFVDEFAHIAAQIADPFFKSVMPTISSSKKAKIVLISTPKGAEGKFYEIFKKAEKGENGWTPVRIHYSEVPGRDADWVRENMASINHDMDTWRQEFEIEFLENGTAAINQGIIERLKEMCTPAELSFDGGTYMIWTPPTPGRIISIGVDVAEGVGQDYTVAEIMDITDPQDIRHCATFSSNKIIPWEFAEKLNQIARSWGNPFLCIERNKEGATVIDALINVHNYTNIVNYNMNNDKRGVYQSPGIFCHVNSKYSGIQNMKYYIERKQAVSIYDIATVREFETFVRKENKTWAAKKGHHDDRIMAIVWALVILKKDIAERYLEVLEYDEAGSPIKIIDPNQYMVNLALESGLEEAKPVRDMGNFGHPMIFDFGQNNSRSTQRSNHVFEDSGWNFV